MKILYLESSSFFIKILKRVVEPYGYTVFYAYTSTGALDILESEHVGLVISGTELADMSVLEFIEFYTNKGYSDIPVIIFTSRESLELREKYFSLGVADYILKKDISEDRLRNYFDIIVKHDQLMDQLRKVPIAVLDDSRFSLSVIKNILTLNGITKVAYFKNYKELLENVSSFSIFFIDMVLPEVSGKEIVVEVRNKVKDAIIIVVSGITNSKTVSHALMSGADDYITKPFDNIIFMARLKANARTYFLNRELKHRAVTDGLTGLYNHKYIFDCVAHEVKQYPNTKRPFCLLLLDIDFFKKVNDTFGHQTGDIVLISVSNVLKKVFTPPSIVGRYGGEEFMVVISGFTLEQSLVMAEKYRILVESLTFPQSGTLRVTISGGILEFDGRTAGEMIKAADDLLYKAKKSGRNRITSSS